MGGRTFDGCLPNLFQYGPIRFWSIPVIGTINWTARVYGYGLGLTDRYPPFSFS